MRHNRRPAARTSFLVVYGTTGCCLGAVLTLIALGDRTFPVAAARGTSLPPQTRAASSILTFPRETNSHFSVSHLADRNLAPFPAD